MEIVALCIAVLTFFARGHWNQKSAAERLPGEWNDMKDDITRWKHNKKSKK